MDTMRAVVQSEYGGPEVLHLVGDAPVPEPLPTEVQVEVRCAGVNPVDAKTREGASVAKVIGGLPMTVGWDVAGVVSKLGVGVTRFDVGDRVYGMPHFPHACRGYAEYVTAPSRQLVLMPEVLDFATAASLPLPATTAYQIVVDTAKVTAGHTVLVLAAGGSVGSIAVQVAKKLGARVIGTDTGERLARLEDLGMDRGIDFTTHEFDDPDLPGGAITDVDVVIDLVGGEHAVRGVRLTKPGGLVIGVPSGQQQGLAEAAERAGVRSTGIIVEPDRVALEYVSAMITAGELDLQAPRVEPLDQVVAVHRALAAGAGKTVLLVSS